MWGPGSTGRGCWSRNRLGEPVYGLILQVLKATPAAVREQDIYRGFEFEPGASSGTQGGSQQEDSAAGEGTEKWEDLAGSQ